MEVSLGITHGAHMVQNQPQNSMPLYMQLSLNLISVLNV